MQTGSWRRGVPAERRAEVAALLQRVRRADGRAPEELPGDEVAVLPAEADGRWVGLAWRNGSDPAELYVDPEYRSRGYGAALASQVLPGGGIWAHGTLRAAAGLAVAMGATATRELLQLRRPLDAETQGAAPAEKAIEPLPVELPDGVTIRTFRPGIDDDAFLGVNARAFAWHPEQGRLDAAGLAAEMAQPWFDADGFFLAVDGAGTVLGFHWTKVHPADPTPPPGSPIPAKVIGEVYVIGVDPQSPVRGLGAPLTAVGLNYLAGRGLDSVMLYVEADNAPALRLYDRFGFTRYAVDTVFTRVDPPGSVVLTSDDRKNRRLARWLRRG